MSLIQHAATKDTVGGQSAPLTWSSPLGSPLTPGNRLILRAVLWGGPGPSLASITDNLGLRWNGPVVSGRDADNAQTSIWDAVVSTLSASLLSSLTINVSNPGAQTQFSFLLAEYSGLSAFLNAYIDGTASANGGGANGASGASSPAPGFSQELAVGLIGDGGYSDATLAAGAGWSLVDSTAPNNRTEALAADQLTVAGSGSNAQFTNAAHNWSAICAVYKYAPPWLPSWLPSLQLLPTR